MFVPLWSAGSFVVMMMGLLISDRAKGPLRAAIGEAIAGLGVFSLIVSVLCALVLDVAARDVDGRYANSDLKTWFDSLRSRNGPCCSDADGYALSDVDWEAKDGHYRVRIPRSNDETDKTNMIWLDVPDDAVITEPNRAGRTMVWPIWGYQGPSIRCFMPGSMT
jgi:hypothetical protein